MKPLTLSLGGKTFRLHGVPIGVMLDVAERIDAGAGEGVAGNVRFALDVLDLVGPLCEPPFTPEDLRAMAATYADINAAGIAVLKLAGLARDDGEGEAAAAPGLSAPGSAI